MGITYEKYSSIHNHSIMDFSLSRMKIMEQCGKYKGLIYALILFIPLFFFLPLLIFS